MANTTNFGWETPDDTDLVKDGALAMRTLGNAIDTSLVDLKGGTTGQVLSKNTNTDMDFTWVTPNDADAIQNSIVDAKGDLIAASANDTPARLAVGNNGETLVADSSATVGLRYSATPSASNPVLNSAFQIWQRGTSTAGAVSYSNYVADRWVGYNGSAGSVASTWSRQTTNDTTNLPNIQYCIRAQRNNGNTGTGALELVQAFESVNSIPYAGKTITFSFYARKGANFSASSDILVARLFSGTGTDQNPGTMSATNIVNQNTTLTTTWQRFSYTGTVATTATQLCIQMYYTPTGTAGAADFFEATGFQIDIGSVALPFRTQNNTLAGELAACQRYYEVFAGGAAGFSMATTVVEFGIPWKVTKRGTPTLSLIDTSVAVDAYGIGGSTSTASTIVASPGLCDTGTSVRIDGFTGLTQYRTYSINQTNTWLAASSEL